MKLHVLPIFLGLISFTTLNSATLATKAGNKILFISFFSSKSHKNVIEPLLHELANRGHELTVISAANSSKSHKNIREIVGMSMKDLIEAININIFNFRMNNEFLNPMKMSHIFNITCRHYYEMPEVQAVQKQKFDLVIGSSFMNECTYGFIHKMNTTFMFIHPQVPAAWTATITGAPVYPSFIPLPYFGFTDRMNFYERFVNTVAQFVLIIMNNFIQLPNMESIYRDYVGQNYPGVHEIEKNTSLILMNSHFSTNFPRPLMPDMIDIGGIHCRDGQPLPKDLEDYLSGAGEDGFIYFSMGSVIPAHYMPESHRKIFLNAFAKLKQRVIWKWETGSMPDLPPNVKLEKWLPQQDVLAHSNIRLFITHGGLLSTEEALYHGVPLVGIPIYSDQDPNMKQSESKGFALTLEFRDLTEDKILFAVNRILNEPHFRERVKYMSTIFKDRPQKPLDTAVYWTEYVMRHKGAMHLRSPARDLNFFQYHSLDVISVILTTLSIVMYIIYCLVKLLVRRFYRRSTVREISKKCKRCKHD